MGGHVPERSDQLPSNMMRLEDYLDGRLEGAERAAFEAELGRRPDLRAAADLQGWIDEGLVRALGREGVEATRRSPWGRWRYAAAAAVALAALPLLWFGVKRALETDLEAAYRRTLAAGFQPAEVCTTDGEFRRWVWEKYQAGLAPGPDRGGVEFVGWSYSTVLGPYTALLLARADGREVLVVMDRKEQAAAFPPSLPRLPGLRVFKREIGKLAFFEVTPLDHPAVIEVLREAEPPGP